MCVGMWVCYSVCVWVCGFVLVCVGMWVCYSVCGYVGLL